MKIDLTGQRFGRLLVVCAEVSDKHGRSMWRCRCDCGQLSVTAGVNLRLGATRSCGCLWKEGNPGITLRQKGRSSRLYEIWAAMKQRCSNPCHSGYSNYGGRGITVCAEWLRYRPFHAWALANGYKDSLSLDRIDGGLSYEPSNCRWVPVAVQGMNTRRVRTLTVDGYTHSVAEWARLTGVGATTIIRRLNAGWTPAAALTTPNTTTPKETLPI